MYSCISSLKQGRPVSKMPTFFNLFIFPFVPQISGQIFLIVQRVGLEINVKMCDQTLGFNHYK